jgi:hypothetical protein
VIINEVKSERIHSFIVEPLTEQVDLLFSSDNKNGDEKVSGKKLPSWQANNFCAIFFF